MGRQRKKDPHLPKCVYFKNGAHWYVKGKQPWKRLPEKGPSTLTAALAAYAEIIGSPKGAMPDAIDAALTFMQSRQPPLAPATLKQYGEAAKILKRKLVQFSPQHVLPKHIAAIKVSMVKTPNMANRCLSFIREVFEFILEQQLVDSNPAVGITRYVERKRSRLPSRDEYDRIYAESDARLQVIEDLYRTTGQRVNAVLKIKLVDLVDEGIRFPQFKTPTKRIVKWTPELRAIVDRAKGLHGRVRSLTWLLPGRNGKSPDYGTIRLQFAQAAERAGVKDVQMRDMRAVAATEAKKQGKNPKDLLGHTTEATTRRYLRDKEEPVVEGPTFSRHPDRQDEKIS